MGQSHSLAQTLMELWSFLKLNPGEPQLVASDLCLWSLASNPPGLDASPNTDSRGRPQHAVAGASTFWLRKVQIYKGMATHIPMASALLGPTVIFSQTDDLRRSHMSLSVLLIGSLKAGDMNFVPNFVELFPPTKLHCFLPLNFEPLNCRRTEES